MLTLSQLLLQAIEGERETADADQEVTVVRREVGFTFHGDADEMVA